MKNVNPNDYFTRNKEKFTNLKHSFYCFIIISLIMYIYINEYNIIYCIIYIMNQVGIYIICKFIRLNLKFSKITTIIQNNILVVIY